MTEPVVVGLLGITHPHASARVRALREIDGVQVVAAADDDPRLKYFTDKYDLTPVTTDELLADEGGAAGADRDDVTDESLVEQLSGAGHGVGEAHVVADLGDRAGCLSGLGQLPDVGERGATGLLDEHGLTGVEDT